MSVKKESQAFFRIEDYSYSLCGLYAGKDAVKPAHTWGGVRHHFIFHLIARGSGMLKASGRDYVLKKGDGFFVLPDQPVRYQASQDDPWHYLWVGFTGNRVSETLALAGVRPENPVLRQIGSEEFRAQMESIVAVVRNKKKGYEVKANGILYDLIARLIEKAAPESKPVRGRQEEYIERITRFIFLHYGEELTVAQLAAAVGLDRSYLTVLFKKATGKSLSDFLIHYRIEKAKELLSGSKLSVQEVSFTVGYSDHYAFTKRFKKMTGLNPLDFRNQWSP